MSNQNTNQQNQNWRSQNYIEDSRNHPISRPENYYPPYSSSQYAHDYMQGGYSYPPIMAPFRPNEFQISSISDDCYSPLNISPETFSKFYNKGQGFTIQNSHFGSKNYADPNNFYVTPSNYKTPTSFGGIGAQTIPGMIGTQLSVGSHSYYAANQSARLQKVNKGKSIIVIQSDEENVEQKNIVEPIKVVVSKFEQKQTKYNLKHIDLQQKKNSKVIETQQQIKQILPASIISPIIIEQPIKQKPVHSLIQEKQIQHQESSQSSQNQVEQSQKKTSQIISLMTIDRLYREIEHQLDNFEFPDMSMQYFLRYKTHQILSTYQETEVTSLKIFNTLKLYKSIISFEKQRKKFMENSFINQLTSLTNRNKRNRNNSSLQRKQDNLKDLNNKNIKVKILNDQRRQKSKQQNTNLLGYKQDEQSINYPSKTKKISKKDSQDHYSQEVSFNGKNKNSDKYDISPQQQLCERRLRDRKKKKNKKQRYQRASQNRTLKDKASDKQREKNENSITDKQQTEKQNPKAQIQFSHEDEGLIEKIRGWADKTILADDIEQKHKKPMQKPKSNPQGVQRGDPFRVIKKEQNSVQRKNKERSNKASQMAFRQQLAQKIAEAKMSKQVFSPNLITFTTASNLSQVEREQFQKQLTHLIKQMRNNESHGKIRVGKQYYQAKMPQFIRAQSELQMMRRYKRGKLMQRKMTVMTF